MRPTNQLTIDQHYPMNSGHDISLDPASGKLKHSRCPMNPKAHTRPIPGRFALKLLLSGFVIVSLFAASIAIAGMASATDQSLRAAQGAFPVFTDVTVAACLAESGTPFGNLSWGDFDGDGYLDLWVDNHYNSRPYFYKNNGNGTFTDVFTSTGLDARGDKHGNGLCDYNNDGNLDLHITIGAA